MKLSDTGDVVESPNDVCVRPLGSNALAIALFYLSLYFDFSNTETNESFKVLDYVHQRQKQWKLKCA